MEIRMSRTLDKELKTEAESNATAEHHASITSADRNLVQRQSSD